MSAMGTREVLDQAADILARRTPMLDGDTVAVFVQSFLARRESFLDLAASHGSPLYALDTQALRDRAAQFKRAFIRELPASRVYYAVKSNSHPMVVRTFVEEGLGLDVSSGLELELAVASGARNIVFSGPGKTDNELQLAVEHADRTTVLLDSFSELRRLERIAGGESASVRAGVRLTVNESGLWRKFGIPLTELANFMSDAAACQRVHVCGLQFHNSWNHNADRQVRFIARIGRTLEHLIAEQRALIEFVDVGGGFWPPQGEWLQPAATPEGSLRRTVMPEAKPETGSFCRLASTIEDFARRIGEAYRLYLLPQAPCTICMEPGRWLSHEAMHLLVTVIDKKAEDLVITDAGTNAVAWEQFKHDYSPVINLTRPGLAEQPCHIMGSLCTPQDCWGYTYHGDGIEEEDILLIPTQGAYTYSLRQDFIKPLPRVVELEQRDAQTLKGASRCTVAE